MSQENKMRIRKYVHHSRQSNELGRRGGFSDWLMEYLHLFFDIIFLCYLIAQSIAKTGKKGKKKKTTSSLLWKVTTEVDGMELLSLDNKTTNSGNNNYQKTVQAKFWPIFLQYLVYLLKEPVKILWK